MSFFIALYNKGVPDIKTVIHAGSNIKENCVFDKTKLIISKMPLITVAGTEFKAPKIFFNILSSVC
jgi:hypothetical protein